MDVYTPHVAKHWEKDIVAKGAEDTFGSKGCAIVSSAVDGEFKGVGAI
jgi:hypothetical protein